MGFAICHTSVTGSNVVYDEPQEVTYNCHRIAFAQKPFYKMKYNSKIEPRFLGVERMMGIFCFGGGRKNNRKHRGCSLPVTKNSPVLFFKYPKTSIPRASCSPSADEKIPLLVSTQKKPQIFFGCDEVGKRVSGNRAILGGAEKRS